ncbi:MULTISPECIES: hypothetical protein [unclassified Leucobacter]|uniref:hypothetical protein n=1 Tax=unclassified Leucobacter TaxID=2621730 RepID=UPI003016C30E
MKIRPVLTLLVLMPLGSLTGCISVNIPGAQSADDAALSDTPLSKQHDRDQQDACTEVWESAFADFNPSDNGLQHTQSAFLDAAAKTRNTPGMEHFALPFEELGERVRVSAQALNNGAVAEYERLWGIVAQDTYSLQMELYYFCGYDK